MYCPPRTSGELDRIEQNIREERAYFERICFFAKDMAYCKWYSLDRLVSPENREKFADMICYMIARCGAPLEFDNRYARIRRI